jgi:hypothetical protein
MDTIEDLKEYIEKTYNVKPKRFDGKVLEYHSIKFERRTGSALKANAANADMWMVQRTGHSIDFFRTEELTNAVSKVGSLLYYFLPR